MIVRPITLHEARRWVASHHRHSGPPRGHLFSCAAEVLRVCVGPVPAPNACSMVYGALRRAGVALGYARVVTYTLAEEDGASVRAAGFRRDGEVVPRESWAREGRARYDSTLFGDDRRPTGAKVRWVWP